MNVLPQELVEEFGDNRFKNHFGGFFKFKKFKIIDQLIKIIILGNSSFVLGVFSQAVSSFLTLKHFSRVYPVKFYSNTWIMPRYNATMKIYVLLLTIGLNRVMTTVENLNQTLRCAQPWLNYERNLRCCFEGMIATRGLDLAGGQLKVSDVY